MLNDLSFMINLTMISLSIPCIAQPIMSLILQFIYLDLLQTDLWLSPLLAEGDNEDDEDEALNSFFEDSGFQSMFMIKNLGSTFIFMCILFIIFVFQLILHALSIIIPW